MHFRTFFFLLFIIASAFFFLSSFKSDLTLSLCGSMCQNRLSLEYIQLSSMITSSIAIILFVISNYFTQKRLLKKREQEEKDRLNIEEIHAELESLKS